MHRKIPSLLKLGRKYFLGRCSHYFATQAVSAVIVMLIFSIFALLKLLAKFYLQSLENFFGIALEFSMIDIRLKVPLLGVC